MKYTNNSNSHVGHVRIANEDHFGELQTINGHLFVVCDGMGGHVGGAQASKIAVNSIFDFFNREEYDNVIQAIDHAFAYANEQIFAYALNNEELKGMGTTAVILLIKGDACFFGHVGDSRLYLRSDGKLNRITKDHSYVQNLVNSGIIDDDEAENHPNKNQILQALGISSSVKGTICQSPILPKAGDMFLLCSDGLNSMVKDQVIEKLMQENTLQVTTENLITAALNEGGNDNVTVSLVLIEESPHTVSSFHHFNPIKKLKQDDFSTTQQFSEKPPKSKKKLKLPITIGIILVLITSTILWLFLNKDQSVIQSHAKRLNKQELEEYLCNNIEDIKEGDTVNFESGKIVNLLCEKEKITFFVKDSLIVEIKKEKIIDVIPKDPTKNDTTTATEGDKIKINPTEPKTTGKIDSSRLKQVTKEEKPNIHLVKKGETLNKISADLGISKEDLIKLNVDSNKNLNKIQRQNLEQEKIADGMKLIIPSKKNK